MKTVTVDDIMSMGPCEDYTREQIEKLRKSVCGRRKRITVQDVLNTDIPNEDKAWLIFRNEFFTDEQIHKIRLYAVEKFALPVWLKCHYDDGILVNAIRVKKLWLKGKAKDKELSVAISAINTVVIDAVRSAAWYAARSVARFISNDAVALDVVIDAVWSEALYVECDAARYVAWYKIFKYALRLAE